MTDQTTTQNKPLQYRDFNLRFAHYDPAKGTFKVWVEGETPGGSMKPENAEQLTFDPKTFWDDPILFRNGLLGRLERLKLDRAGYFDLGARLADLALPKQTVRPLFEKSLVALKGGEGLRLRLRIDAPELAQLPWEFMLLPQASGEPQDADFLALRRQISIVRTDTVEAAERKLPTGAPRIVGVLSAPLDQDELDISKDKDALAMAIKVLNQAAKEELIQLVWVEEGATRAKLEEALKDGAAVFQYSGHADFAAEQQGQLYLEDAKGNSDPYSAQQLAVLLGNAGVRLVMLSACESGRRNGRMVWSGLAPALTRERIPAVVANQYKIRDTAAILLAARLYPRLLSGYTIDEALFEARQAIHSAGSLEESDWGVPVLYLRDTTGVLFTIPERNSENKLSNGPFLEVADKFGQVEGNVVDVALGEVTGGQISVHNTVDVVKAGANFTSVKINKFGADMAGSNVEVRVRNNEGKVVGEQRANAIIERVDKIEFHSEPSTPFPRPNNPQIEEKIRVDAAAPNEVVVGEIFDLAVAIRQPNSPVPAFDDLSRHFSAEGTTFRADPEEVVRYRVAVSASNCEIYGRSEYVFLLKPCRDSEVVFFQLSAKKPGRLSILVQAYQDDDNLAAMTRVQLIAQIEAAR
jgi:hypothetical protein